MNNAKDTITLLLDNAFASQDLQLDSLPFKLESIQPEDADRSTQRSECNDTRNLWGAARRLKIYPFSNRLAPDEARSDSTTDPRPTQCREIDMVDGPSEALASLESKRSPRRSEWTANSSWRSTRLASFSSGTCSKVTAMMRRKEHPPKRAVDETEMSSPVCQATQSKRLSRPKYHKTLLLLTAIRDLIHALCGCLKFMPSDQVSDRNSMRGSRFSGGAARFSGEAFTQQLLAAAILAGIDEAIVYRNVSQSFKENSLTDVSEASTKWNQSSLSDRAKCLRHYGNIYDNLLATSDVKRPGRSSQGLSENRNLKCATCVGRCPICRRACCTYCAAQDSLTGPASRHIRKMSRRLIEAVDRLGFAAESTSSFSLCTIKGGCGRRVCSNCCGICPNKLCNDIQCKECKLDPWSECEWHAPTEK